MKTEVIEKGASIETSNDLAFIIYSALVVGGCMVLVLIILLWLSKFESTVITMTAIALIIGYLCAMYLYLDNRIEQYDANQSEYAAWVNEYVQPYIRTRSYTDHELITIRKNQTAKSSETPHLIEYRNEDQIIESLTFPTHFKTGQPYELLYDVPADETPFIRMYQLKTNLGHGVVPGEYGLSIHLNKKEQPS